MTDADSLQQIAHSRAPFSAWFGTILLFMLFGVIVLALIGPAQRKDHYEESRAQKRVENLKTLRDADAKALSGYAWVDKTKGTVHIPIERAMQLTLAELSQKKPTVAYPIVTAPAAAAPAAAPSATPTAPSKNSPSPAPSAQPAAAANPPNAPPGTQPGARATPQTSPAAPSSKPAVSPSATPNQKAAAPLPVAGQTPAPTP
jgi:hypothetical protein